jgi:two-component system response regulator RegX3
MAELVSRVRALVRRCELDRANGGGAVRAVGGVRLDLAQHQVFVDERSVYLTTSQFKLLALLVEHAGSVVTRRDILERLWESSVGDEHVCDVHISNLRQKIEREPSRPTRILTVRGSGYKLVAA